MLSLRLGLLRSLHSTAPVYHLIGPPDPVSHIRPVIYDDVPPPPPPSRLQHPYSLAEFDPEPPVGSGMLDVEWRLQRQQIDNMDQNFWHDSNIRFESGKNAVLASLPNSATALDKENAMSEFYKQWVMQESQRTDSYTMEWRAKNVSSITLAARATWAKVGRMVTFQS